METFHNYNIKEDIDTEKVVPWPIIPLKWERGGGQPTLYGVTKPVYTFENNFLRSDDWGENPEFDWNHLDMGALWLYFFGHMIWGSRVYLGLLVIFR